MGAEVNCGTESCHTPTGSRTPVFGLRTRRPGPLDDGGGSLPNWAFPQLDQVLRNQDGLSTAVKRSTIPCRSERNRNEGFTADLADSRSAPQQFCSKWRVTLPACSSPVL